MQDAVSPPRKRWIQFTLRDCLIASLAIAATIAPLKLYERFNPPSRQVMLRAVVYEANAAKLAELTGAWNDNQLCPTSKDEVAKVIAALTKIKVQTVTAPTLVTLDGQEVTFSTGRLVPIYLYSQDKKSSSTPGEISDSCSVTPHIQPNGRVRLDVKFQQLSANRSDGERISAVHVKPTSSDEDPAVVVRRLGFPAELATGETVFFCDMGDRRRGKGTVIEIQVTNVK